MNDWDMVLQIANLSKQVYNSNNHNLITEFDNFLINGGAMNLHEIYEEVAYFVQCLA